MSSPEQPGKSGKPDPKPHGGDESSVVVADVEKQLGKLEAIADDLAEEIGTPDPKESDRSKAQTAVAPSEPADAPIEEPVPADSDVDALLDAVAPEQEPATDAAASDVPAAPMVAAGSDEADPDNAQAEIDQEINQALQQLQTGIQQSAKDAVTAETSAPAAPAKEKVPLGKRMGPILLRGLDLLLYPVWLLLTLVNLPFRWMPDLVRQLSGYIAVGTALMAGALWMYILLASHAGP